MFTSLYDVCIHVVGEHKMTSTLVIQYSPNSLPRDMLISKLGSENIDTKRSCVRACTTVRV